MRRRSLQTYFKKVNESTEASVILGGGEFRKKGANVKNWKIRSYYIKDDRKLLYFDPISKEPKGVVDVSEVIVSIGPKENLQKSGSSDFSSEVGYSIMISLLCESINMELVFDSKKEVQKFCLLLGYVATASNVTDFVRTMRWDDIALAIEDRRSTRREQKNGEETGQDISPDASGVPDVKRFVEGKVYRSDSEDSETAEGEVDGFIKERPSLRELAESERAAERELFHDSMSSDDEEEFHRGRSRTLSDTSIIYSGYFFKQGQFRKNWKRRYFEIWSTGILVYKETKESVFVKGRLDLRCCISNHIDVYVPASSTSSAMESPTGTTGSGHVPGSVQRHGMTMIRVSALEIKSIHDKRVFMVAFDVVSPEKNASQMEQFEIVLKRLCAGTTVLSSGEFISGGLRDHRKKPAASSTAASSPNEKSNSENSLPLSDRPISLSLRKEVSSSSISGGTTLSNEEAVNAKASNTNTVSERFVSLMIHVSDSVTHFVDRHKDLVLIVGIPVWIYLLVNMCNYPSVISILLFCCMTTFFGAHYSSNAAVVFEKDDFEDSSLDAVVVNEVASATSDKKNV